MEEVVDIDIEHLSEEEFEKVWAVSGLKMSKKAEGQFAEILEACIAKLRLEAARKQRQADQEDRPSMIDRMRVIAEMTIDEVRRRLSALSDPGLDNAVYARKLEECTEEDLRSLLLDLERANETSRGEDSSPGHGS
jgi:hypothetical protein